jgi:nucleotide-binding universal stress UspA family protein
MNVKKSGSYKEIQFHEMPGLDPEEVIEKFIKDKNIDLLAMFTRKRKFFARLFNPSLTESLSYDISIPLLAFKKE